MAILQAIILGIIEGLTEFLPISSTGHLVVAERLIGYKDAAELFTVVVQLGAIAAVLWFYRKDLINKISGLFGGSKKVRRFWINWITATIPAGLAGLLLADHLSRFATLKTVATSLIIGGVIIWIIETYHQPKASKEQPQFDSLTTGQAVRVGLFQIISLIPGVSRSGATIMGGLLSGLDRVTATAFSFYLSMPIIILAGIYKLIKDGDQISQVSGGSPALVVGTLTAFIAALLMIRWLLHYVAHNNFKPFAYYRIVFGALILLVLSVG